MPSVLTLTALLLREEGGGGGGLIKNFNLLTGGLFERRGLLELLRYCEFLVFHQPVFRPDRQSP